MLGFAIKYINLGISESFFAVLKIPLLVKFQQNEEFGAGKQNVELLIK